MTLSTAGKLFAGFGRSDITPAADFPNGIWMAQKHARATGIHRRLYISCVIVGAAEEAVALLNYDLTILSGRQVEAIRGAIHERIGLPPQRIWLYVTHNHAAPVTQDFYDREGADEVRAYVAALPQKSAEAAQQAWDRRRPAQASSESGRCHIGVNRDLNYRGRMITGPNPEGFTDPEVGVVRLDGVDGAPIAAIVTYGCHPTYLGPANTLISPDYPGVTRDTFESVTSAPCLFLQGGAGNVGPARGFQGDTAEVERCGRMLACEAARVYFSIPGRADTAAVDHVVESGAPLGMLAEPPRAVEKQAFGLIVRQVRLPTDNPGPTVYDTVERDLEAAIQKVDSLRHAGAPDAEIQQATQHLLRHRLRKERRDMYAVPGGFPIEVGALRMGNVYLASVACEAYAELGVAIKERSPSRQTIFAAYQGPDVIYIAPREAYQPPVPMEVFNSPFGPDAATMLVERTVAALHELSWS
jgi:neutral ceramidase